MTTDAIFTADAEGFREQNTGRPAAHLMREAVQNVFDEVENGASMLTVVVEWEAGQGVRYWIVDDVPGGIRDGRLIHTIWLSDKTDSPTKRGRMGRGLKELISVGDETLIVTEGGPATLFERHRGKWTRTSPRKVRPKRGTEIEGWVKLWLKRDADAILEYLRRMRPPEGLRFVVNHGDVERQRASEVYRLKLPTVKFELSDDGSRIAREPRCETTVELFSEPGGAWVYEMGIPVEAIDFPMSIDVGQRVPLREKRDTLTEPYRRELFAKLLDARMALGLVADGELKDKHVMLASHAPEHLSTETKVKIAEAWTEGKAYASTPQLARAATGMHIPVVPLRALPESIRDIAREVGTDVKSVIENIQVAACQTIAPKSQTRQMQRLVAVWEWIAEGIGRRCTVQCSTGQPSALASFSRVTQTLTLYVEQPDAAPVLDKPLGAAALGLLIHELAHWEPQDENAHGFEFHSDAEDVGGAVAAFLFEHASEAKRLNDKDDNP